MSVKLYLDLHSQPCRAIVIFCRMNNIPFTHKNVSFIKGDTRSEWFMKINPMHHVPVLQDDDFVVTESVAILRYLMKKYNCPDHWYPADIRQRARVDEFLMWLYCTYGLRTLGSRVFVEQALQPHRNNKPPDPARVDQSKADLRDVLGLVEGYFLKKGYFLGGCDDVTLADLMAACEVTQPMSVGFDVTWNRPRLAAWFQRVKMRLQPHFDDVHKDIFSFSSSYQLK